VSKKSIILMGSGLALQVVEALFQKPALKQLVDEPNVVNSDLFPQQNIRHIYAARAIREVAIVRLLMNHRSCFLLDSSLVAGRAVLAT
jgi:hypothetical protein